jgi:hypothetical protein
MQCCGSGWIRTFRSPDPDLFGRIRIRKFGTDPDPVLNLVPDPVPNTVMDPFRDPVLDLFSVDRAIKLYFPQHCLSLSSGIPVANRRKSTVANAQLC